MKIDIHAYFRLHRQIFGVCPSCHQIFRLSDCSVYSRVRPSDDWKGEYDEEVAKVDQTELRIEELGERWREEGRAKGRKHARALVVGLHPAFSKRPLRPEDARALLHPFEYVVFEGLSVGRISRVSFLDRKTTDLKQRAVQDRLGDALHAGRVEWRTFRIAEDGSLKVE